MNLRIPLSVFAVASVIGVMAVTAIAAMSMQKAYSQVQTWCFKASNGRDACYSHGTPGVNNEAICNEHRDHYIKQGNTPLSGCFKD
jgi:hypothetical protein